MNLTLKSYSKGVMSIAQMGSRSGGGVVGSLAEGFHSGFDSGHGDGHRSDFFATSRVVIQPFGASDSFRARWTQAMRHAGGRGHCATTSAPEFAYAYQSRIWIGQPGERRQLPKAVSPISFADRLTYRGTCKFG
jgi:hypothetical protein